MSQDNAQLLGVAVAERDTFPSIWGAEQTQHFTDPSLNANLQFMADAWQQAADLNNSKDCRCKVIDICRAIRAALASYIHALQDFYSHTNYVQFSPEGQSPPWAGPVPGIPVGGPTRQTTGHRRDSFYVVTYHTPLNPGTHSGESFDDPSNDPNMNAEHLNALHAAQRATARAIGALMNTHGCLWKCSHQKEPWEGFK